MEPGVRVWVAETLRAYPELAVFFALAIGFAVGPRKIAGFTLGNVTATLLAGVLIGQLHIPVGGPIKSTFFLIFLFAVGFGVGPQFFRGLGKEGPKQIAFSLAVLAGHGATAAAADSPLIDAVRNQDHRQVRTLLDQRVDVNAKSGEAILLRYRLRDVYLRSIPTARRRNGRGRELCGNLLRSVSQTERILDLASRKSQDRWLHNHDVRPAPLSA